MNSKPVKTILFFLSVFLIAGTLLTWSTEEYASQTGRNCIQCHVDPDGGTNLTAEGKAFAVKLEKEGLIKVATNSGNFLRIILDYLHMMTAFIWFGSILYIHIFLKPSYVAKGIPKGELKLGWISMIIMLLTGIILTWYKIPSLPALFRTRFGVFLVIKLSLFIFLILTLFFVTFVVAPKLKKRVQGPVAEDKEDKTTAELEKYDGQEGRPAYIAVSGKIYDVTASKYWHQGSHLKQHMAGMDLTNALKHAPHGDDLLTVFSVVGNLVTGKKSAKRPFYLQTFYFLAYLVLVVIFLIIFIISIWKK